MQLPVFTPLRVTLLGFVVVALVLKQSSNFKRWRRMRVLKKMRRQSAFTLWLKSACDFAEWRSKHNRYDLDGPYYQWHIQRVAATFSEYLDRTPKKRVIDRDHQYLKELNELIEDDIRVEEPPD